MSDGMTESASIDIKYELKRARICTKKIRHGFHTFRFFKRGSWSGITRCNKPRENLTHKQGLI